MKKMMLFSGLALCAALLLVQRTAAPPPVARVAAAGKAPVQAAAVAAAPPASAQPPVVVRDRLHEVEAAVAKARARGADENEVYRLRAAGLTAQMIAMLGEREQAEHAWNARVAQWTAESARLGGDAAALQALQDRMFSKEEQGRLGAYIQSATPQLRLD